MLFVSNFNINMQKAIPIPSPAAQYVREFLNSNFMGQPTFSIEPKIFLEYPKQLLRCEVRK
jgi:hypothetical protein